MTDPTQGRRFTEERVYEIKETVTRMRFRARLSPWNFTAVSIIARDDGYEGDYVRGPVFGDTITMREADDHSLRCLDAPGSREERLEHYSKAWRGIQQL
jgi:hypothetical protein